MLELLFLEVIAVLIKVISVERTSKIVDVPVGPELLGRVVDPLGNPFRWKRTNNSG